MILELLAQLHDRDRELSGVQQRLDQLLRRLYGPKGERFRPEQPGLFDLLSEAAPEPPPNPQTELAAPSKKGRRHGRRLPADLPRQQIVHDVPESEKTCPCCRTPRVKIGEEVSEQLDYQPAKLFVWQHVRLKYACPTCANAAAMPMAVPPTAASPPSAVEPLVVAYSQRHWLALVRFTEQGFLIIDNNASERALRAAALGRKNWPFAGSDKGGVTAAIHYTMTQTCRRHGIDPFVYLRDVLTRLPQANFLELADLFPHRWAKSQRDQLDNSI